MGRSRKRIYSLRNSRKIVQYSNSSVLLANVELVVQEAGRNDTLVRTQENRRVQKTVHAFLRGDLVRRGRNAKSEWNRIVKEASFDVTPTGYDPHKTDAWLKLNDYQMPEIVESLPVIRESQYAFLNADGILVANH